MKAVKKITIVCPNCGYDYSDLTPTYGVKWCPECGMSGIDIPKAGIKYARLLVDPTINIEEV